MSLNVSKTGMSTSIGKPGATVFVRGDRARGTVGPPGSGLSYSSQTRSGRGSGVLVLIVVVLLAIAWLFL